MVLRWRRHARRRAQARAAVLEQMLLAPDDWHYSYDLWKTAGVRPRRLYPALWSLEADGLLEAEFEPHGAPPRRRYRLADPVLVRLVLVEESDVARGRR